MDIHILNQLKQPSFIPSPVSFLSKVAPYAPPSLFAYSSSIASSYRRSASFSASVFSVWLALATACVALFATLCAVSAVADEEVGVPVAPLEDVVDEGMGTGMVRVVVESRRFG